MQIPRATYRIQFSPEFGFGEAKDIVPYLARLGVSHLYASPIFAAYKKSRHGYDIVDPNRLNPALGTDDDFDALIGELHRNDLLYIQDIVPNHLAYDSDNWMLMDVLETETTPIFSSFFDIQWNHEEGRETGRLLAPFLARPYHECLADGEIKIVLDEAGLGVTYADTRLPLRIGSYTQVLGQGLVLLLSEGTSGSPPRALVDLIQTLNTLLTSSGVSDHYEAIPRVKQQIWQLYQTSDEIRDYVDRTLDAFNRSGARPGRNLLDDLLSTQRYKLAFKHTKDDEINYRRFFTVNTLISVNMQRPEVFEYLHRLTLQFVDAGKISGLRIDHIDGLYNPAAYLEALRSKAPNAYIVVEKVLSPGEYLPTGWKTHGTTGYDFLNRLNSLFCESTGVEEFEKIFRDFTAVTDSFEDIVHKSKRLILERYMRSEVSQLARLTCEALKSLEGQCEHSEMRLREVLVEIIAFFPVYRTYDDTSGLAEVDEKVWLVALKRARKRAGHFAAEIEAWEKLVKAGSRSASKGTGNIAAQVLIPRLQQYTGPAMAKGFEDTALYLYNRLISLNEVGGNPEAVGIGIEDFHAFNEERLATWPHSMSATSTHDTKRGEDARARINVLSEVPAEWEARVNAWRALNRKHTATCGGRTIPDANLEYLIYQSLVGAWPFDSSDSDSPDLGVLAGRMKAFAVKAAREAKTHTSWDDPDNSAEEAIGTFIESILDESRACNFLADFRQFEKKVSHYGILNSLSQTLLKLAAPGVPDIYQGSELWNFNLVDPDNRRPVDFRALAACLDNMMAAYRKDPLQTIADLLSSPEGGRLKLLLTHRGLMARKENIAVFAEGSYIPIESSGKLSRHVVAFARSHGSGTAIAVAPRLLAGVVEPGEMPLGEAWGDTEILLPRGSASGWKDAITGEVLATEGTLRLAEVLKHFPVALLLS